VGTLVYFNIKYSAPHNFSVLDSMYNHIKLIHKAIATNKQSYKYLLVGFTGFSDVAKSQVPHTYKRVSG